MAGVKGKSGGAHGGPQYNPMNVSPNGSNGQMATSTQKAMYIPGQPWGQGKQTFNTEKSAPLAGDTTAAVASNVTGAPQTAPQLSPLAGLTDINHGGDPTDGLAHGSPIGPDAVPKPAMAVPQPERAIQMVQAMYALDPSNRDLAYMFENLSKQGRV